MKERDEAKRQRQVEESLRSLDNLERARPEAGFYARVQARIADKQETVPMPLRLQWRAVAAGLLLLFIGEGVYFYQNGVAAPSDDTDAEYLSTYYGLDAQTLEWNYEND